MTSQTDADRTARNIQLVQAGYDAFTSGDLATLETLFDPEVVWHAQRLGALSGDHKGWPELLRFFGGTMEMSRGTFRVTVTDRPAGGAAGRPVAGHRPGQGPPTRGGDAGLPAGHAAGPHPAVA